MENTLYHVHSDVDENNTAATFEDRESAIEYAKECGNCWVDEVFYDEDGEIVSGETIWTYAYEDTEKRYSLLWIGADALNVYCDGEEIAYYDDEREAMIAADELTAKYADRLNPIWGGIAILDNVTNSVL